MSTRIPVFLCEDTGDGIYSERYSCDCGANKRVDVGRFKFADRPDYPFGKKADCDQCGGKAKLFSTGWSTIYRRAIDGQDLNANGEKLPPGACYFLNSEYAYAKGHDGRSLVVVCPDGHHWYVDSRASNCTKPNDKEHRCWIRHGRPEDGTLHVDKNGNTCGAGAGSIQTPNYHGFLHNGYLVQC